MTYITYKKAQYSDYKMKRWIPFFEIMRDRTCSKSYWQEGIHRYSKPPKKVPLILPKPNFMPRYLVRISDMKVVQGSEVQEGYCALSYSWNQSGEIIKNETDRKSYQRVDQGKHRIIFPEKVVPKKPRGRKRIPQKVKFVKFEGLIQEICTDFNIKYIWYDQMCINQVDEEEKRREICQMHKIYSHAYCTIALIPELKARLSNSFPYGFLWKYITCEYSLLGSQWMKRMWTLEEAIMSSQILFVGFDVHSWWYCLPKATYPIFSKLLDCSAASILHYAHTRTSTKEHDRIFALANIFPDIMKEITIDYNQDIQKLIIQFYGILAEKDLSILCFGGYTSEGYTAICAMTSVNSPKTGISAKEIKSAIPILNFDLPSWTGVYGEHFTHGRTRTSFKNYSVVEKVMHVTCNGLTNNQYHTEMAALASFTLENIPPLPHEKTNPDTRWILVTPVLLPGCTTDKLIKLGSIRDKDNLNDIFLKKVIEVLGNVAHFMPVKRNSLQWIAPGSTVPITDISFYWLTETLQKCVRYVLLSGIQFDVPGFSSFYGYERRNDLPYYPIIKKSGDYYEAIGVCSIAGADHFLNGVTLQEQKYEIR